MNTICTPQRDHNKLTLQELGLLTYITQHLDCHGTFSQRLTITADDCLTTRPVLHRVTHSLISKKYLTVVRQSVRGEDGWMTPLVVKPIPLAEQDWPFIASSQVVENKTKPIPLGTLPDNSNTDIHKVCGAELCSTEGYVGSVPPAEQVPIPSAELAPSAVLELPRIPICSFDDDCTNAPIEGSTFCYRHASTDGAR